MGIVTANPFRVAAPVAHGGNTVVAYPAGFQQADFIDEKASPTGVVVVHGNDVYEEAESEVLLIYNPVSVAVVNLSGVTWGAGAEILVQLAWLSLTPGGDTVIVPTPLTAEAVIAKLEEAAADEALALRMGKATVPALQEVVDEAGQGRSQLATAVVGAQVAAVDDEKLAVWGMFTGLGAGSRAAMMGGMLVGPNRDGPLNLGEIAAVDVDGNAIGYWPTPASTPDIIDGTAGETPQDPENYRVVRDYYDATDDIAAGALDVDLREHPNIVFEFDSATDLGFVELPETAVGQGFSGRVEFTNTDGSQQTLTFILSGSGRADVVPVNGTGTSIAVPAGETRAIYVSLAAGGWYEISQVVPT